MQVMVRKMKGAKCGSITSNEYLPFRAQLRKLIVRQGNGSNNVSGNAKVGIHISLHLPKMLHRSNQCKQRAGIGWACDSDWALDRACNTEDALDGACDVNGGPDGTCDDTGGLTDRTCGTDGSLDGTRNTEGPSDSA